MKADGGPAFPGSQPMLPDGTWDQDWAPGMTLRDWFAGMAMQGLNAHYGHTADNQALQHRMEEALCQADAMLEIREVKDEKP